MLRKTMAYFLCCLILLFSIPGQAAAENSAKNEFITNYLQFLENNLEINLENMQKQNVIMNLDAELLEGNVRTAEGTNISNLPANGSLRFNGNMLDSSGQVDFNGQFMGSILEGTLYLDGNRIILPRDTVKSLAQSGVSQFPELGSIEDLPPYLVYITGMSAADADAGIPEFSSAENMQIINQVSDGIIPLMEVLLNIIPEDCYYYSNGYAVLDLKTSIINSAALLTNLKNNREELADKLFAIIPQPAGISEEEFNQMKSELKNELISTINSINIYDLANKELPFKINEFKISSTQYLVKHDIDVSGDVDGVRWDFNYTGNARIKAHEITYNATLAFDLDSPDTILNITVESTAITGSGGEKAEILIAADLQNDEITANGKLRLNCNAVYSDKSQTVIPYIDDSNSKVVYLYDYLKEDFPATDSDIKVLIDGQEFYFFEAQPAIVDNRTLVPLRELAETLGCDVNWIAPDTIIISNDSENKLTLKINSPVYQIGNEEYSADAAPQIINNYTYIPIRILADYLGLTVEWDSASRTVILNSFSTY